MKTHSLPRFICQFVRKQFLAFLGISLVSLVWSLDQTLWPYIIKVVVDIMTAYDGNRLAAWDTLKIPFLGATSLWLLVELGWRGQGFLLARALPRIEADIRMAMFDHVQRHSPKYFNDHFAGSLANKITDMTTQTGLILRLVLTLFFPAIITCLMAIGFAFAVHGFFALIFVVWTLLHFGVCILFARGSDRYENIHGELRSQLLGKIVDSLTNNFVVNLFYRFKEETRFILTYQQLERASNQRALIYVELMRAVLSVTYLVFGALTINGMLFYFWFQHILTTGQAVQIFNLTWNLTMIMWVTGLNIPSFFQSVGIAKQALTLMQDPQDLGDTPQAKSLVVSRGEIIFESVSFRYGEKQLFANKTVKIAGGSRVGLVGFSGAGKSSFINLILRFYAVESGTIWIDGQDISQVTLKSLRRQVALIPQEPLLFHRSLKENIQFGRPDASHEQVIEAARQSHCMEFIERLPQGIETVVGERGTKLSGGERQRVSIARAILADAPILLLDEATSSLDSLTERYIQGSFLELMANRTTLVIAHRLSTLVHMDRILVFDRGVIIEDGSHGQLLQAGGLYARLWHMQAGGFLPNQLEE